MERRISRERILTEATLYWATQSIGSSFRTSYDGADAVIPPVEVPAAVFVQRHEHGNPESVARRFYRDLRVFDPLPEGGHFAVAEVPAAMAERVRGFVASCPESLGGLSDRGCAVRSTGERRATIMKLITNTQITVDGVMQANGGNNPTLDPGFDRGGWALALADEESTAYIGDCYLRADAFLFGRRTYELFAGYWGVRDDVDNPFVRALNSRPKFVASTTITDPHGRARRCCPEISRRRSAS